MEADPHRSRRDYCVKLGRKGKDGRKGPSGEYVISDSLWLVYIMGILVSMLYVYTIVHWASVSIFPFPFPSFVTIDSSRHFFLSFLLAWRIGSSRSRFLDPKLHVKIWPEIFTVCQFLLFPPFVLFLLAFSHILPCPRKADRALHWHPGWSTIPRVSESESESPVESRYLDRFHL